MTWRLIRFPVPTLGMADHPVVVWPMQPGVRLAQRTDATSVGLVNLLEARIPLAPHLGLVMAWADKPDVAEHFAGGSHHARNFNAFSRAEAERHWIHRPGSSPRSGTGPWLPLAPEIFEGYSVELAKRSQIRASVSGDLNAAIGTSSRKVEIRYLPQEPQLAA